LSTRHQGKILNRRTFCGLIVIGVGATCLIPKSTWSALLGGCESDVIVPRDCILSEFLDRTCPGWQRWQSFPYLGDGIWFIPRLEITNGQCHIIVNGTIVAGAGVNVDSIQLNTGDNLAT